MLYLKVLIVQIMKPIIIVVVVVIVNIILLYGMRPTKNCDVCISCRSSIQVSILPFHSTPCLH
jgi:hypothetical protein